MTRSDPPEDPRTSREPVGLGATPPVATARELALALGSCEIDDLRAAQPELAAAIAQLSLAAGEEWPTGVDDPVVLLLRALARLSIKYPDATSAYAAEVIARHSRLDRHLTAESAIRTDRINGLPSRDLRQCPSGHAPREKAT